MARGRQTGPQWALAEQQESGSCKRLPPLSIVSLFWHNANFEKVGIIDRRNYRERKILMFYYEIGTDDTGKECDYRQSFLYEGIINERTIDKVQL